MKHFLLTLLLTFIVGVCSAQTEHMKFKGVPMEGTLQTFTSKLKAKGFMPVDVQDGVSLLKVNLQVTKTVPFVQWLIKAE